MDDLAGKISEFLNNPQNMEQIKSITGLLGQDKGAKETLPCAPLNNLPDISSLPVDTINTIAKIMPMLTSMNNDNDSTKLLESLRPFLKKDRQKKLDEAARMLQMMQLIPVLKSGNIL